MRLSHFKRVFQKETPSLADEGAPARSGDVITQPVHTHYQHRATWSSQAARFACGLSAAYSPLGENMRENVCISSCQRTKSGKVRREIMQKRFRMIHVSAPGR